MKKKHELSALDLEGDSEIDFDVPMWPRPVFYDPSKHGSNNAHRFLKRREEFSRVLCSDNDLYTLDLDIWQKISDAQLMAEIRQTDRAIDLDINKVANMVREIKIARDVRVRPFEWINEPNNAPSPKNLILANNGIYDVATGKLMDLTPDYFATGVPDWEFDPAAICPTWLKKLDEWLDPSFHDTLQEWFGYTLTPDTSLEKMAAFIGASRGGKGTVKHVLEQLTGKHHRASLMLNDLAGDFGLERMIDKKLLIIPDASDTEISKRSMELERIKSITGNDTLSVNRKNKAILDDVLIPAKITMLANRHPKFIDESGALAIRELMFIFNRTFVGKEDLTLKQRLASDELSGIANWAIQGLKRLRKNGKFTVGEQGRAAQSDLKKSLSPALRYASECLIVTSDAADMVPVTLAFSAYEDWANRESLSMRERRNKSDFQDDVIAALRGRGVSYASKQTRWHDPHKPKRGNGERIKARFLGVKMARPIASP
jgi:P4 family phage/plasmid primase-like protien